MSTRKQSPRTRTFRPQTDDLESRQLLSGLVSGTDSKGDAWTLQLIGPGQLSVVKQNDATGNPASLNSATDISTITIGGTVPNQSRLVGKVTKVGANSDGRVFFNNLVQLPSTSETFAGSGLGILSIDMPNFWLGRTTPASSSAAATAQEPGISMPDGTDTLRFGGVDATVNLPTPTSSTVSDTINVVMGLPTFGGTRILIDKSITNTQQAPASSATASPTTVQHGVTFAVSGRLDLFQANQIVGDKTLPPGQFKNFNANATGSGGTVVVSGTPAGTQGDPTLSITGIKGLVTGQIGDLRIGGDATNLTTVVYDISAANARISNFSVGGETTNVLVVAPNGARNLVFGKGMDTVEVRTHVINTLKANRGAVDSKVIADRQISRVDLGGNVVNTQIQTGYQQNFTPLITAIRGSSSIFGNTPPAPAPDPGAAIPGGGMTLHVAGDVTNSIFAASYQPFNGVFGDPNSIALTDGTIRGKIEGNINNADVTPDTPLLAFYARNVYPLSGPVIPPNVPEAPYTGPQTPTHLPGIHHNASSGTIKSASVGHVATPTKSLAVSTPKGPVKAHSTAKKY